SLLHPQSCSHHSLHSFPTRRSSDLEIEARLITADRMASIGTLAAGVAHSINNPLAYIMANIDFALESLDPTAPTELAESLREARDRKSTRLNSSHVKNSYAVFCLKK